MTSIYSYLFKAFYDWFLDNDVKPRLLVDASKPGVKVPREYVVADSILISINSSYIADLNIGATGISFVTKFKGKSEYVVIPYYAMNELVCADNSLSIPLNMWMISIELACHPNEMDVPSEEHLMEHTERQDENGSKSESYSVTFEVSPSDDDDSSKEITEDDMVIKRDRKSNMKPDFVVIE